MSDFKYDFTQILTLIYQAKKEQILTEEERKTIKEHIITNEPDLTVAIEAYNKDKDLSALAETLKLSAGLTSMSSPLDTTLLQRKKMNQKKKKQDKKKNGEEKKVDLDEENCMGLQECDLGNSPVIQPKAFKKTKQK